MQRGEVWWAELPSPVNDRPVLILTRNAVINTIGSVVVALVTRTNRGLQSKSHSVARKDFLFALS
jgi:mRNA interferase MazF